MLTVTGLHVRLELKPVPLDLAKMANIYALSDRPFAAEAECLVLVMDTRSVNTHVGARCTKPFPQQRLAASLVG